MKELLKEFQIDDNNIVKVYKGGGDYTLLHIRLDENGQSTTKHLNSNYIKDDEHLETAIETSLDSIL